MESARFYDLSYLKMGTALQRKSYDLIRNHRIMEALQDFKPVLIGTIPIDIAVWNSDLDIACEVYDLDIFKRKCHENFEKHNGYSFKVETVRGIEVGIANFKIDDMLLEVYGEGRPVAEQYGFRHLLIEAKLLETFGEEFKQQIIKLKSQGIKTEPAFAKLLKIQGDPYEGLLNYNIE
ncbi:DUF4269 domain-containing protein [Sphingobacterium sp. NPDC055346]